MQSIFTDILAEKKQRFDVGDALALFDCIVFCDKHNLPVPRWAVHALAVACRAYEKNGTLDDAFFGAARERGVHGDPRNKRADTWKLMLVRACVQVARLYGYRGDQGWEKAQELLRHNGIELKPESIRTIFARAKKLEPLPAGPQVVAILTITNGKAATE